MTDNSEDIELPKLNRKERPTREMEQRPMSWQPASVLPEPDKQPGYSYRWVRVSSGGQYDPRNLSKKRVEGWEPVRIEEQPIYADLMDPDSRFKDNIEIAGLLLCKIPTEIVEARTRYFKNYNAAQLESVYNHFMRENDPRMPLFRDRKSTVSFGSG